MSVIQPERLSKLLIELCSLDATTNQEKSSCDYIEELLSPLFQHVVTQPVGTNEPQGRRNLLAYDASPRILLTTHIDTVPPFYPPRLEDGVFYGRGVCDAKGILASMVEAARVLKENGVDDVGLLFVVGEETNSDGAKAAAEGFAPEVDFFINGEPTELKLGSAMKGVLALKLSAQGIAGHSAYPEVGHSAVHQLIHDLHLLQEHAWPNDIEFGQTTLNVGRVEGGLAGNVIAPYAEAHIVIRTTVSHTTLEQKVRALIHETTTVEVLTASSPVKLHTVDTHPQTIVSFGSDIPHLSRLGKALLYGPGSILDAHTDHEKVSLKDLLTATQTYIDLVDLLPKLR